jgi:2-(1,2-epoxy-1,2-dihydrophenyl)acetyl-CoA isomerase
MSTSLLTNIEGAVGYITLNRPQVFNSFNREMALHLQATLQQLAANPQVRCIVITGAGKAFCAGQDIGELLGDEKIGFEKILKEHYNPIVAAMRALPKPIVVAVNGVAAGAGANIALAADVVVAADNAAFIQAFSKIGLIPDSGGTFTLPRLIGFQKASALMMLGDKVSATEAEKLGMLYKVFPAETLQEETKKIAETLAALPTKALALTKQALNQSLVSNSFEAQLLVEDELQFVAAHTTDYAEGIQAFVEKRSPKFTGQ